MASCSRAAAGKHSLVLGKCAHPRMRRLASEPAAGHQINPHCPLLLTADSTGGKLRCQGGWRDGRVVVEGKEGGISVAVAVSSVRGKPKPRATKHRQLSPGSLDLQQPAPRGAATTSHTFSPPGLLLAFPGCLGKSSNPNEQSVNASTCPYLPFQGLPTMELYYICPNRIYI